MCIAIYKPHGKQLPDSHVAESFASNPDGAGFATICPKKGFIIQKGFFTLEEFERAFRPYALRPALVHFRIATSGGVNPQMCHPFSLCGGKYAMIHNGIIDIKAHKGKSDTATFADAVLTPLLERGIPHTDPALRYLVETSIGKWNKILIMDTRGKVAYFNEQSGHYTDGIWYSNESYLPPVRKVVKTGSTYWSEELWDKHFGKESRQGVLLNEPRMCIYCDEPIEVHSDELYCEDCLEYAEYCSLK